MSASHSFFLQVPFSKPRLQFPGTVLPVPIVLTSQTSRPRNVTLPFHHPCAVYRPAFSWILKGSQLSRRHAVAWFKFAQRSLALKRIFCGLSRAVEDGCR